MTDERERYYREAESWGHDHDAAAARSRRVAWIVAAAFGFVALAEACALVALTPLKTVQPYTLLVDRQTGYVQALDPITPSRIAPDAALTQSFVVQYVIARESFDIAALQANYRKVAGWSEGAVRSGYIATAQASNPASPLATLPRASVVETRVKSISVTGSNTVLVRFDTQRRDQGGQVRPAQPWVAVLRYRYTGEPQSIAERFQNPLGFRVTHYQRSPEALPPPEPAATQTTGMTTLDTTTPAAVTTTTATTQTVERGIAPSPLLSVRQPGYVTILPGGATSAPRMQPYVGADGRVTMRPRQERAQ